MCLLLENGSCVLTKIEMFALNIAGGWTIVNYTRWCGHVQCKIIKPSCCVPKRSHFPFLVVVYCCGAVLLYHRFCCFLVLKHFILILFYVMFIS